MQNIFMECKVHQDGAGIISTLRKVLVQVWGKVDNKDFGAPHLGGKLNK